MNRSQFTLTGALAIALVATTMSVADEVDPNFLSRLNSAPEAKGLELDVLHRGDEIEVRNDTGQTLVVEGYGGEPYLRFLPNGTVQENRHSPAPYLNQDRFATKKVPSSASSDAKPLWKRVGGKGTYEWHDHRVHYMGKGTPRQVKDETKRQKVFDWTVEMHLGNRPVAASGTLFWIPTAAAAAEDGGGSLLPWLVALLALAVVGLVVAARRRRPAAASTPGQHPDKEAW